MRRRSIAVEGAVAASRPPHAAPANTKPLHGKSVNTERSPEGRRYHCSQPGNVKGQAATRTSGVTIDVAIAAMASTQTRVLSLAPDPQSRPVRINEGPMTLRISTRNNDTSELPGLR